MTFRIDPGVKEVLHTAAQLGHRPCANMLKVLIRDYGGRNGISIEDRGSPYTDSRSLLEAVSLASVYGKASVSIQMRLTSLTGKL